MVGVILDVIMALGKAEGAQDLEEDLGEGRLEVLEDHSTLSHVTSVGCVAIWHITVFSRLLGHRVVSVAPFKVVHQDPGNEARETVGEEVDDRFVSGTECLVDVDGYEYPMDAYGQIYVPLETEQLLLRQIRGKCK